MAEERETLTSRGAARISKAQRERMDIEKLLPMPEFKRFIYTWLERAPMFSGIYGADGRHLAFGEGRRSLGYDILRTLEIVDASALSLIMAEEVKSQKEAPNGRRKYDRHRELGTDDGPDGGSRPGDGFQYLYDQE